jgi:hypothetical protein
MPRISSCPACQEKIAVPDNPTAGVMVQCPVCHTEFALGEVIAAATEISYVVVPLEPAAEESPARAIEPVQPTDDDVKSEEPVLAVAEEAVAEEPVAEPPVAEEAGIEGAASDNAAEMPPAEEGLVAEADSLRAKAEALQSSSSEAADQPETFQAEADSLHQAAQSLLAKTQTEVQETEAQAQALTAKADHCKTAASGALTALADALENAARLLEEKCSRLEDAVQASQSPSETSADELPSSEPTDEGFGFLDFKAEKATPSEEPEAVADLPETSETSETETPAEASDQQDDMFAFLTGAPEKSEESPQVAEEESMPAAEPEMTEKVADSAEQEDDLLSFLSRNANTETEAPVLDDGPIAAEEPTPEAAEKVADSPEQEDDFLSFLRGNGGARTEASEEAPVLEMVTEEPPAQPEAATSPVQETDLFSFLNEVDRAAVDEPTPEEVSEALPVETSEDAAEEPAVVDDSNAPAVAEPEAEPSVAVTPDSVEPEAAPISAELEPAADAASPAVDTEAVQAQIETLRSVVEALKAKAAELRAQAGSLRGEVEAEEELAEPTQAEEGWTGMWQPEGETPAIETGMATPAAPGRTLRPGRKRKEKSAIGELIGVVLGGVAGLTIAYYGLNIFGGARYDFAKIYLPGIKHTVKHRPPWWPTWARFESVPGAEDQGTETDDATVSTSVVETPKPKAKPAQPKASKAPSKAPKTPPKEPAFEPTLGEQPETRPEPPKEIVEKPADQPTAQPFVNMKNRPTYGANELGKALKAAHNAFGCPKCNSTGKVRQGDADVVCPDCKGNPPKSVTPAAYTELCHLGEVLAFLDANAVGGQIEARKSAARDLLEKLGANPQNVLEVKDLAVARMDDQNRNGPGFLFAGTVQDIQGKGQLQRATVKLAGVDRTISVIADEPMGLEVKDRVLVLGCLAKKANGNSDPNVPLFVWHGMVVKFAK